jgi:hypothetical protein
VRESGGANSSSQSQGGPRWSSSVSCSAFDASWACLICMMNWFDYCAVVCEAEALNNTRKSSKALILRCQDPYLRLVGTPVA